MMIGTILQNLAYAAVTLFAAYGFAMFMVKRREAKERSLQECMERQARRFEQEYDQKHGVWTAERADDAFRKVQAKWAAEDATHQQPADGGPR